MLALLSYTLAPLPAIPGLVAFVAMAGAGAGLWLWMLVISYKAVPKLGIGRWFLFLLLAVLLGNLNALIFRLLMRPFKLPTGSMETTILRGDHLFVQTSAYWFAAPSRGDVVVFRTDELDSSVVPKGQVYLKRVAGLPGEAIQITGGRLLINDQPLRSPAVLSGTNFSLHYGHFPLSDTDTYVVPDGAYFVLGDNLANSLDSRHFGAVRRQSIIGRATKICWPLARAADIR
jgi:signal peptidase I